MRFIKEPFIEEETTVLKVSYKGNIWERRENNKVINWFVYDGDCLPKKFMYHYEVKTNTWRRYINDCITPEIIEIPYVEKAYLKKISVKKLYKFSKWFGKNGTLEGIFIAEHNDVVKLIKEGTNIYFGEVLGKHSDITCVIKEQDITRLDVCDTTVENLLKHIGNTVSGYNPFDYLKEE